MKELSVICLSILLFGCNSYENKDATINYYLSTSSAKTISEISFQFDFTRAHRNQNKEIRSVNLDQQDVRFDLGNPAKVFLGSSTIEPQKISWYDFGFSDFRIVKENDTFALVLPFSFDSYTDYTLLPSEGQEIDVTFILDVESSIVLDSAGQNWIKPNITIEN